MFALIPSGINSGYQSGVGSPATAPANTCRALVRTAGSRSSALRSQRVRLSFDETVYAAETKGWVKVRMVPVNWALSEINSSVYKRKKKKTRHESNWSLSLTARARNTMPLSAGRRRSCKRSHTMECARPVTHRGRETCRQRCNQPAY